MFVDQKDKLFCEIAVDLGFVSNEQVAKSLEEQGVDRAIGVNSPIGEYLFKANILTKEQIGQILKVQGKLEQTAAPPAIIQPSTNAGEAVATPEESQSQVSAWLVVNPIIFFYNCYALTFNLLYAKSEFNTWLWIGIALVINFLIFASYPDMIRAKAPQLTNGVVFGAMIVVTIAGCAWGYMSGNPYTNKLIAYHNSYFKDSYNAVMAQHNSIVEILQKSNPDDSEFLNLIKYKVGPKFTDLVDGANKMEPPFPVKKMHEDYISSLKQYKTVIDDLVKSTEAQNAVSIKASFAELKSTFDRLVAAGADEKKICQANGMVFQ